MSFLIVNTFWLLLGVADSETFSVTTLSRRRVSLSSSSSSSHLEVGAELVEGVLQVVEEEDVASRGPAD